MRVFALSQLGKKVASKGVGDDEERQLLSYLQENKTGTEDELGIVASKHTLRKLVRQDLVRELTK